MRPRLLPGRRRSPPPAIALVVLALAGGCALRTDPFRAAAAGTGPHCTFTVRNQTPVALEVRLRSGPGATTHLGTLDSGQLLTHALPCAMGEARVVGLGIGWQAGVQVRINVEGATELLPGERPGIVLHWP